MKARNIERTDKDGGTKVIKIPDNYFRGKKKGYIKKFNIIIKDIDNRIYQAKMKGKNSIDFIKGTGHSYLLDNVDFDNFIRLLEVQFRVSLNIFYQGSGEKIFIYSIEWS